MASSDVLGTSRSAHDVLTWSRDIVDPALRAAIDDLPLSIRRVPQYHFGWSDERGQPSAANGGKALRPTLTLLMAEAFGGTATAAVPAAVAVELIHNFSLLHDDVMDGDHTRRHRPTAWRVFGVGDAILAGDALLTLAVDLLVTSGHPAARNAIRMLNAAVLALIDGQSTDLAFEVRSDVELTESLRMVKGKTGALLGCACALGGLFGGASDEQVALATAFGDQLGVAFQFVDDILGIWGDPAVTGKPVHSDLYNRKKSLPVVAALTSDTPAGRELAALYQGDGRLSDVDVVRAAELIDRTGARSWCQSRAETLLASAVAALNAARPTARPAADLITLAHLVTRRDH